MAVQGGRVPPFSFGAFCRIPARTRLARRPHCMIYVRTGKGGMPHIWAWSGHLPRRWGSCTALCTTAILI